MDKFDKQARSESFLRSAGAGQGWLVHHGENADGHANITFVWRREVAIEFVSAWRRGRAADLRGRAAASAFAALGGRSKSPARAAASRANGAKGGRPKKVKTEEAP